MRLLSYLSLMFVISTCLTAIPIQKESNSLPLELFVAVNTTTRGYEYLAEMITHIQDDLNVTVLIDQIMPLYVTSEDSQKKQTDLSGVELKIITNPDSVVTIRDVEDSAYNYYLQLDKKNVFYEITRSLPKPQNPKSDKFLPAVFLFCASIVILLIYFILKWTGYPNNTQDRNVIDY